MGKKGFSMIEVLIILAIFGVVVAAQSSWFHNYSKIQKHHEFVQNALATVSELQTLALSPRLCSQSLAGNSINTAGEASLTTAMVGNVAQSSIKIERLSFRDSVYAGTDSAGNTCYSGKIAVRLSSVADIVVRDLKERTVSVLVAVNGANQIVSCPSDCTMPPPPPLVVMVPVPTPFPVAVPFPVPVPVPVVTGAPAVFLGVGP